MGLIEDFATWTERIRRSLLRESGEDYTGLLENLPQGVPVSRESALFFVDSLVGQSSIPEATRSKAEKWRIKLCRMREQDPYFRS